MTNPRCRPFFRFGHMHWKSPEFTEAVIRSLVTLDQQVAYTGTSGSLIKITLPLQPQWAFLDVCAHNVIECSSAFINSTEIILVSK